MSNEQTLAHLTSAEANLLDALSHIRSAKLSLGGEVVEPPGTDPPPIVGGGGYELRTSGKSWLLVGRVEDWAQALVFPMMTLDPPGFAQARIEMEMELGEAWDGLHCFFDLIEDKQRWKGDHAILANRGDNGALAVSHTLDGKETTPVRKSLPLVAGQRLEVIAQLANGVWTVQAGATVVTMPTPALTSYQLRLQLGQDQDESHASNAGTRLLSMSGSVA